MAAIALGDKSTPALQGLEPALDGSKPEFQNLSDQNSSPVNVDELFSRVKADSGDFAAINALSERYMPLVQHLAVNLSRKLPDGVELQDFVQAGYLGLRDAILAFEPGRGVKFETYCALRVRGAMLDSLREMDWVPRLVRAGQSRINRAVDKLRTQLSDRAPTEAEVRDFMESSASDSISDDMRRMLDGVAPPTTVSLSKTRFETDSEKEVHEIDTIQDSKQPRPEDEISGLDTRRALLRGFNKSERLLYIMYVVEGTPMKEIGLHLGLSESRVSQMFSAMIRNIRDRVESAADSGSKNELSIIALNYNVARTEKRRVELAPTGEYEITQRVMMRLEEMNSLSQVSFEWREGRGEFVSNEPDQVVTELIARAARQRLLASREHPQLARVATDHHSQTIAEQASADITDLMNESFPRDASSTLPPRVDNDAEDNFGFKFIE